MLSKAPERGNDLVTKGFGTVRARLATVRARLDTVRARLAAVRSFKRDFLKSQNFAQKNEEW